MGVLKLIFITVKNMAGIFERKINVEYTITGSQIEKTAKKFGASSHVILPKRLRDKDVIIIVPDEVIRE